MKKQFICVFALASTIASAGEVLTTAPKGEFVDLMQSTRAKQLLRLQSSGQMASRNEQRLSGDVQSNIYQRYIESFTHDVPDTYIQERFTE